MRQIFYAIALCAITLCGCKSTVKAPSSRIDELRNKYDKFIALTFDDGPSTLTPKILDLLERYDATATFFVIGNQVDATTKATIRRAVELGCEIGNHSFTHPYMTKLSTEEQIAEAQKTTSAIEQYAPTPKYFRPPYMDADETTHSVVPQIFIGGHCPSDWDANVSAEERYNGLMERAKDGTIFLLHDFKDNVATAEALAKVLPTLQAQGYGFVSVSELFEIKNITPQKGVIYRSTTEYRE